MDVPGAWLGTFGWHPLALQKARHVVQYIQGLQLLLPPEERESLVLEECQRVSRGPWFPGSALDHDGPSEVGFISYRHL